jgi:transposase InsO family protein
VDVGLADAGVGGVAVAGVAVVEDAADRRLEVADGGAVLSGLGVTHRRGGYRDPESQAFIESRFGKLEERLIWRNEYETLVQAREAIGGYVDRYHARPHSSLDYRTPEEVRQTWEDAQDEGVPQKAAD